MGIGALAGALLGLGASAILPAGMTILGFSTGMLWLVGASIGSLFDAPKLNLGSSPSNSFGPLQNTETQLTPVPVVYGRRRVGGNIFFHRFLNEERTQMDMFVSMSEGPISGISSIMASDQDTEDLSSSSFTSHLGTFPQSADALCPSGKGLGYPGTAYVACHLEASSKLKGTPVISAIVEGRTVWTPPGASTSLGGDLKAEFFKVVQSADTGRVDGGATGTWSRSRGDKFFEADVEDIDFADEALDLEEGKYYAKFTGYLQPASSGNYQFRLTSTTGVKALYIDGEQVTEETDVPLVADQVYSIRVEFCVGDNVLSGTHKSLVGGEDPYYYWYADYYTDGTEMKLYWTPPGSAEEVIPSTVLHGGLSAYSRNPVWQILDFLRNKRYGLGLSDEYFDIDFEDPDDSSSWETAADYCDETVNGAARFQMDIVLDQERSFIDHLQEMLASFRGYLICRDVITIHIEKYETSYQKILDTDNIIEGSFGFFAKPQDEIPNRIEVEWVDPSTEDEGGHWDRVVAIAQNDERILNEGPKIAKFPLLGITRLSQAQDMADYLLGQAENALLYMTFSLGLQDSDIEVGEVVKVDHPMLDTAKWARVLKIEDAQEDRINVLALEYYIPDYDYTKSWEDDVIVLYGDHIYKSIEYIPTMVDWATPSGAVSGGDDTGQDKEYAFDKPANDLTAPEEGTAWHSSQTGTGVNGVAHIGQIFTKERPVQHIKLKTDTTGACPTSIKVQEYDPDTETWSDVETFSSLNTGTGEINTLTLTTLDNFWGLRLLANADLATDTHWTAQYVEMKETGDNVAPTIPTGVNEDYWELVE